MGIFDDDDAEIRAIAKKEASQFEPQELSERNVQAIFNRCLDTSEDRQTTSFATLFPPELGYEYDPDLQICFNNAELLKNKKNIKYLYGQLKEVHSQKPKERVSISDYTFDYSGKHWSTDKGTIMELLYLGVHYNILLIEPFRAQDDTSRIFLEKPIKPTLSPKDPNFPAWWEEHKSEWEEPKKEGKEPADD